jgi:hypothetical protein
MESTSQFALNDDQLAIRDRAGRFTSDEISMASAPRRTRMKT